METCLLLSQIRSCLLKAMLTTFFLFLMSSSSPRRETSFFIFRFSSVSLLLLFNVITSIFVPITWRFPDDSIFATSRITIDFRLRLKSRNHQHILTRLVGLTAFVLRIVVYWYIFNFFTEFPKIMFKIDYEKWSTYSISLWWSYISLDWFCVCSLNFDFSIFVSLSSTLRILISSSSRNFCDLNQFISPDGNEGT